VTAIRRAFAHEKILLARYATNPDAALEAELVKRFEPLAQSLASRYRGHAEPSDDLRQVASLGLVKALRRYDPTIGKNFSAFAAPTVLGELRRHFRDHTWRLRMPRAIQENSLAVERASGALSEALGRSPTTAELAKQTGLSVEAVLETLEARESQRSVSLDVPTRADEPESATMSELLGGDEIGFDQVEAQLSVERCAGLTAREKHVIQLRFVEGLNQYEIGELQGVSQMQVSRTLRSGLAKMLEAVQGHEQPDGRRTFTDTRPDARFPHGRVRQRSKKSTA